MNIPRTMAAVLVSACLLALPAHGQGMLGVGIVDSQVDPKGAFVSTVQPGSPAARAGIVSNAIIENGRRLAANSDAIFAAGQARSNATDNAIERYHAYGVRGTSDYVNPGIGSSYGDLENSYAHTYVNDNQQIRQTDSENSPGPGWTELKQVPPGQ